MKHNIAFVSGIVVVTSVIITSMFIIQGSNSGNRTSIPVTHTTASKIAPCDPVSTPNTSGPAKPKGN